MSSLSLDFSPFSQPLAPLSEPLSAGHRRVNIQGGDTGTGQTIELMQQLVAKYKREDAVREIVGKILNGEIAGIPECAQKDYLCYAKSIYLYFRDKIKYAWDPHLVEYLERPKILLKNKIGDCDSKVVAMVAAWESIGLEGQFITIKSDADRKDEYSHVYARVMVPKVGWIVADPTMPKKDFGWEPEAFFFRKYWHGSSDSVTAGAPLDTADSVKTGMFGLGMLGMAGLGCGCDSGVKQAMSGLSDLAGPRRNIGAKPHHIPHRRMRGIAGGGGHHHGGGWGRGGGWSGGWGGAYPVPYPVFLTTEQITHPVPMSDAFDIVPAAELEPDDSTYDFTPRGAIAMRGMGDLGAADQSTIDILTDVYNGTAAKQMDDADKELVSQTMALNDAAAKARVLPPMQQSSILSKIASGRQAVAASRDRLLSAMGRYNNLVSEMNRWLPSSSRLPLTKSKVGMVGLGYLPLAAAEIAGLAVLALAFASAFSIAISSISTGRSIVQDISESMRSVGVVVSSVGSTITQAADAAVKISTIVALAAGAYLVYKNRKEIRSAVSGVGRRLSRAKA